ncbi:MAG: MarR family transcriptional regulator [bacterium]|nr:MarR family transcriptional regulator [bacterium]
MKKESINIEIIENLFTVSALLKKSGDTKIFKEFGLTTSLYAILAKIAAGKKTSSEIQKYIDGTPASITQKLKQLEEKNIISRRLNENDKRIWIFELTPAGKKILEKLYPIYEEKILGLFNEYDKATKSGFVKILKELEEKLR